MSGESSFSIAREGKLKGLQFTEGIRTCKRYILGVASGGAPAEKKLTLPERARAVHFRRKFVSNSKGVHFEGVAIY